MDTKTIEILKSTAVKANTIMQNWGQGNSWWYQNTTNELYTALGFPTTIVYSDYVNKYRRQDIANRVVKAPVEGSWKYDPVIYETNYKETNFETTFESLATELNLYYYLSKVDLLATLGQYSVLFLGLEDSTDPALPAPPGKKLSFVTPIPEDRAIIQTWEDNVNSPRYGLPLTYSITIQTGSSVAIGNTGSLSVARTVHWSRILHIAENTLDNEVYGIPFLEPIYNRLLGLDKLAGASPEMYWRGARPGYTAQSSENAIISDDDVEALTTQLSDFVNNMQRWLYVEGFDIKSLAPQVVSPSDHINEQIKLISAATRIPVRILTGSERGELASSQDERAWLNFLDERRTNVAEKLILRPLINKLIELQSIPAPSSGEYFIKWESMVTTSDKDLAEIAVLKTKALDSYVKAGGETLLPMKNILTMLGFEDEEIEAIESVQKIEEPSIEIIKEPELEKETAKNERTN